MEPNEGVVVAQKYRLEAPLARGGMGTVWSARHVTLGSELAVKFLAPSLATVFLSRFEREARAAAAIQSPHVVHVQDFGVEDGTPYLVMELLHGEDLGARLRREKRLPLDAMARIIAQAGHALSRAHEAGIVHRDIKPSNLFLADMYGDEIVKVLDFGIAKETMAPVGETTKTGEVFGSPHFMSPEQARADKDLDHRGDIWSAGVILYRGLTGKLPFPGEVMGAILAKILVEPPMPVAELAPDLPAELDAFFARALAKKKEERFQTMRELVEAFAAIAEQRGALEPEIRKLIAASGPDQRGARGARAPLTSSASLSSEPPSASSPSSASAGATPPPTISTEARSAPPPRAAAPSAPESEPAQIATGPSIATISHTVTGGGEDVAPPPRRRGMLVAAAVLATLGAVAAAVSMTGSGQPAGGASDPSSSSAAPVPSAEMSAPPARSPEPGGQSAPPAVIPAPDRPAGPSAASQSAPPTAAPPLTAPASASPAKSSAASKGPARPPQGKNNKGDEWGF